MNDDEKTPETLDKTYPANSRTVRRRSEQPSEDVREKREEKVICGTVVQKKKSLMKKITETFLEDDTKSVGDYVFHDVLIPAAKAMICWMQPAPSSSAPNFMIPIMLVATLPCILETSMCRVS